MVTGDRAVFSKQILINDEITIQLITGNIAGFVTPTHKVDVASSIIDGVYSWVVGSDGLSWTKIALSFTHAEPK